MSALETQDLTVSFGGLVAVDGVSLSIGSGERHVLLGPNGAGKTTLFNLIGGQIRPTSGRILLFGEDVTALSPHSRAAAGLARTFQITNLFPTMTVAENIRLAIQAFHPSRLAMLRSAESIADVVAHVDQHLEAWRFSPSRNARVSDLSYGEQRKLEIAMALAHQPRLLLLDEPTAGLSTAETENVVALLHELPSDVTVIVIEHDMDVAFEVGERFTILHQGRILLDGKADTVRNSSEIQAIYLGEDA